MRKNTTVKALGILAFLCATGATEVPTNLPSFSSSPSSGPSNSPSNSPSASPSASPSKSLSESPSATPSVTKSMNPSSIPSVSPTVKESMSPSSLPTVSPSSLPTMNPSIQPTVKESMSPSSLPTVSPSNLPTENPSVQPTISMAPSKTPTTGPSSQPSSKPSTSPSSQPTSAPSMTASSAPSAAASNSPSVNPTSAPSVTASLAPTVTASEVPSSVPSGLPTSSPSVKASSEPSATHSANPTKIPTAAPTAYNCDGKTNTEGFFDLVGQDYEDEKRTCAWVGRLPDKKVARCAIAKDFCPVTCGLCSRPLTGMPSPTPSTEPSRSPTSEPTSEPSRFPSKAPTNLPSVLPTSEPSRFPSKAPTNLPSVSPTGSSNPTGSPSSLPSSGPTVTPPVSLTTTLSIELGPVEAKMTAEEKALFVTTAKKWIEPLFSSNEPEINLTGLRVVSQTVVVATTRRRRLEESGKSLQVDIKVDGTFQPSEDFTKTADIGYESAIKGYFLNQESRGALLEDLKESQDPNAGFFSSLTGLGLSSGNSIEEDDNDGVEEENVDNNNIVIIAGAVSGAAVLMFGAALYIYTKKRRNSNNNALQMIEDDVELDIANMNTNRGKTESMDVKDMGGLFPDIIPVTPKGEDKNKDWEAMTPQVPEPAPSNRKKAKEYDDEDPFGNYDDDATDGGKSQRTFNTLEKIYSNESENASYQSYGYSLDDGLKSKASVSPVSNSNSASEAESGPMKMDLYGLNTSRYDFTEDDDTLEVSVTSPGTVNSGLTTDDVSKAVASQNLTPKDAADAPGFVRECEAPPGKLGVVIDTTKNGPVVHQVKAGSPLENIIYAGDRIIAIDDIDTRGMTASNVTKIMAKKCDEPRKITVFSKTYAGKF